MSYCIATIEGNLTRDPEVVKIGDKDAVEITIAVNYLVKKEETTNFFRILFFDGKEADFLKNYAKKGARITVNADVKTTKKDEKTFTNYYGTRVIQLFNARKPDGTESPKADSPAPTQNDPTDHAPTSKNVDDLGNDFPF